MWRASDRSSLEEVVARIAGADHIRHMECWAGMVVVERTHLVWEGMGSALSATVREIGLALLVD